MGGHTKRLEKLHKLHPSPRINKIREISWAHSTTKVDDIYTFGQAAWKGLILGRPNKKNDRIVLDWNLEKQDSLVSSGAEYRWLGGAYEHSNELSVSMKDWKLLTRWPTISFSPRALFHEISDIQSLILFSKSCINDLLIENSCQFTYKTLWITVLKYWSSHHYLKACTSDNKTYLFKCNGALYTDIQLKHVYASTV